MSEIRTGDLVRMRSLTDGAIRMEEGEDGDGNTLVLEPIVFNRQTEINNPFEGNFMETIAPSAVTKTLKERGDQVKVLFNHGMDPSIGSKPLGPVESFDVSDERLRMIVPLSDTSYNADLKALLRDGALDGASFRFDVLNFTEVTPTRATKANPLKIVERTITELRLREAGPVTFPAYQAASSGIRSADGLASFEPAALEGTAADDQTEEPLTMHSTVAQRSMLLRRLNESLSDPKNEVA